MHVVLLTNILSPYRVPLFNALAQRLEGGLSVICAARSEPLRLWKQEPEHVLFRWHVLPGLHWEWALREWHVHLNWGLGWWLRRLRPEVLVLGGYDQPLYWHGLFYARRRRIPTVLLYESWEGSAHWRRGVGFALKRAFVRRTTVGVAFGSRAAEWLRRIHGGEFPVVRSLNTVDMEFFQQRAQQFRQSPHYAERRAQYPPLLLLMVGSLIPRKNARVLLEALARLSDPDIGLVLVGAGPQEEELRQLCWRLGLHDRVAFEGFRQQEELPQYYALADVLVVPSLEEVWGLVVNEALATGLYVLCSTAVGAAYDLIRPGWNGELFPPTDADALADLLRALKRRLPELQNRRDAISAHACHEYTIERAAEALWEGIVQAYQRAAR